MGILHKVLKNRNLSISTSPDDGLCLLHSFCTSYNHQLNQNPPLSLADIIEYFTKEVKDNIEVYSSFLQDSGTPILRQLELYVKHKIYDLPLIHIFPLILANTFDVNITILYTTNRHLCNEIQVTCRYLTLFCSLISTWSEGDSLNTYPCSIHVL